MRLALQIMASFVLAYWPILALTSVMAFDAPGSVDNRSAIYLALAVMFSPLLIGAVFFLLNQSFWGIAPRTFLILTILIPLLASLLFGYPKLLLNSFRGISSNNYFVKDAKVYFDGESFSADAATFEVVSAADLYARDRQNVYYRGKLVAEADPASFAILKDQSSFYRDKKSVYFQGRLIANSDASSFEQITKDALVTSFYKDKNSVYLFAERLPELDVKSVEVLSESHIKDHSKVFYLNKEILSADPNSFQALAFGESWARDKKQIYYREKAFSNLDPASTEVLERGYVKDKSNVYYLENSELVMVPGAIAKSFKVTNWDAKTQSEATDGLKYFAQGKEVK